MIEMTRFLPFNIDVTGIGRDHTGCRYLEIRIRRERNNPTHLYIRQDELNESPAALFRALAIAGIPTITKHRKDRVLHELERRLDRIPLGQHDFDIASRVGWINGAFVTPWRTYCDKGSVDLVSLPSIHDDRRRWKPSGTLEEWRKTAEWAGDGNPLVKFAACVALTPPILELIGVDGFGFLIVGKSSTGRTTLSRFVGSAWRGDPTSSRGPLDSWNSTVNNVDRLAAARRDMMFVPDDTKDIEGGIGSKEGARNLAQMIFRLVGGVRKGRLTDSDEPPAQWRLLYWATSNQTVREIFEAGGLEWDPSYSVRLIEIPARREGGVFDQVPPGQTSSQFADYIRNRTQAAYGTPINGFLETVVAWRARNQAGMRGWLIARMNELRTSVDVCGNDGLQSRRLKAFGAVYAAGCLASKAGILPWTRDTIKDAVLNVHAAHVAHIMGAQPTRPDPTEVLRAYIRSHRADFVDVNMISYNFDSADLEAAPGFLTRTGGVGEFSFLPDTIRRIVGPRGLGPLLKALKRDGLLIHDHGTSEGTQKNQTKRRLCPAQPGDDGRRRVYCVDWHILD